MNSVRTLKTRTLNTVTFGGMLALSLLAAPAFVTADSGKGAQHVQVADAKPQHQRHDPVKNTQRHLDQLAEKLNLKAEQQAAWQAYSQAALSRAEERATKMQAFRDQRDEAGKALDTATRIEKVAQHMRSRADNLEQVAQETRSFQQVLSPEQQAIFDTYWKSKRHHGRKGHHPA